MRHLGGSGELLAGLTSCPSCGAPCPDVDGPTHPYMVAPPGCWAAFGALQADQTARFGYPPVHGLIVDAYAASHGGAGSARRDRQSVCIHLIALCAVIDGAETPRGRIALLHRLTRRKVEWPRLNRPAGVPGLSHTHAVDAPDLVVYTERGREWAHAVWEFWGPEHDRIREMLGKQLGSRRHADAAGDGERPVLLLLSREMKQSVRDP